MSDMRIAGFAAVLFVIAACGKSEGSRADSSALRTSGAAPADAASRTVADVGFSSPETVLWDSVADVYLVSNINGDPAAEDNNGFISRLKPDGEVESLKWIAGGQNGVTLHGPKGMVLKGDTLFAADVGGVRMFDRRTGIQLGLLRAGTNGLNDLAVGADGSIYATDLEPPPSGAVNAPPAAIYRMTSHGAQPVVSGSELEKPDGLITDGNGFIVAPFGGSQLFRIDSAGTKRVLATLPGGQLDGLLTLPSGALAVTSWEAKAVFQVDSGGRITRIADGIESPAQLGMDSKRALLLIPSFNQNSVEFRSLRK